MQSQIFIRRLRQARLRAKLSQKKLGILAGIDEFSSSARMNQYETGKHHPDVGTISAICTVLNIPMAFLYCEDDAMARLIMAYHLGDRALKAALTELCDISVTAE